MTSLAPPNETKLSGERKRVRWSALLGTSDRRPAAPLPKTREVAGTVDEGNDDDASTVDLINESVGANEDFAEFTTAALWHYATALGETTQGACRGSGLAHQRHRVKGRVARNELGHGAKILGRDLRPDYGLSHRAIRASNCFSVRVRPAAMSASPRSIFSRT